MKRVILSIAILLLFLCQPAYAAILRSANEVTIRSNQVINDDLYIAAGTVNMNGRINGDLIVASGNVVINGTVEDDLIVAGGSVVLNGPVGQSVRVLGGNLAVNGDIGDDLVVAGGNVNISEESTIGRDLVATSGNMVMSGQVERRINGAGGNITIDGSVGDDVSLIVGSLTLTDRASIDGDLTYESEETANIDNNAEVAGEITRREPRIQRPTQQERILARVASFLAAYAAAFLFGLLLLLLLPIRTLEIADTIVRSPWISLLIGFALLFVVPATVILLMILIITIPIGLTLLFLYLLGIYLAKVFVGLALGRAIIGYFNWRVGNIVALLIGLLIVMLLGAIPVLGFFIRFLYIIFGLGAAAIVLYRVLAQRPSVEV